MFALVKSLTFLNLGHVGSKTRSLGQILEKPCPEQYLGIAWSDYVQTWSECSS